MTMKVVTFPSLVPALFPLPSLVYSSAATLVGWTGSRSGAEAPTAALAGWPAILQQRLVVCMATNIKEDLDQIQNPFVRRYDTLQKLK